MKTSDKTPSRANTSRTPSKSAPPSSNKAKATTPKNESPKTKSPTDSVKLESKKESQEKTPGSDVKGLVSGIADWAGNSGAEVDIDKGTPGAENWTPPGKEANAAGTSQETAPENSFKALELNQGELLGQGRNSSPERVTQLQEMLRTHGADIEVDGKFGPRTAEAVRNFQQQNDLKVDGVVGPETMGSLNSLGEAAAGQQANNPDAAQADTPGIDPNQPTVPGQPGQVNLADPNLSPTEQYEHYRRLIEANGGEINGDGATVLGLRGLGVDGARHDGTSNVGGYDDTFVVLNRGPNGEPSVQTFQGATHANQRSSGASYGPDQNGRTVRGVAMLQPGNYDVDFAGGNYQGRWGAAYHVKTQDGNGYVPAYRDTNADGRISSAERSAAEQNGYQASAILFHSGKYNAPSSIGCQTLLPGQHQAFSDAVGRGGFNYTLLDANNAVLPQ